MLVKLEKKNNKNSHSHSSPVSLNNLSQYTSHTTKGGRRGDDISLVGTNFQALYHEKLYKESGGWALS